MLLHREFNDSYLRHILAVFCLQTLETAKYLAFASESTSANLAGNHLSAPPFLLRPLPGRFILQLHRSKSPNTIALYWPKHQKS